MNNQTFIQEALKSIKDHTSKEVALADWALGLGGEFGEVQELLKEKVVPRMELAKEIGDVIWYTFALAHEVGEVLSVELSEETSAPPVDIAAEIFRVQEMIKHMIMHKEGLWPQKVVAQLDMILTGLIQLAADTQMNLADIAALNVAKLQHRYAGNNGNYSVAASADRHKQEQAFTDTEVYGTLLIRLTECGEHWDRGGLANANNC